MPLSNREIATIVWLLVGMVFVPTFRKLVISFLSLVSSFVLHRFVILSLFWMALFCALCVFALYCVGLWEVSNLKTTIFWFLGVAIPWAMDIKGRIGCDPNEVARHSLREAVGKAVWIGFLFDTYNLPIWGELIVVPIASVLTFISVGKSIPKTEPVERASRGLLGLIGLSMFGWVLFHVFSAPRSLIARENLRELIVPLVLSILFTGFMYVYNAYMAYNLTFFSLGLSLRERPRLLRYVKWAAIKKFGLNFVMLNRVKLYLLRSEVHSKADVQEVITVVKDARARELNPPEVPEREGWSPYSVIRLLESEGLQAGRYDLLYPGCWTASAPYKWIGEEITGNSLRYSVYGTQMAATKLQLVLSIRDIKSEALTSESQMAFARATELLLVAVFGKFAAQVAHRLAVNKKARTQLGLCIVMFDQDDGFGDRSEWTLTISHAKHVGPL